MNWTWWLFLSCASFSVCLEMLDIPWKKYRLEPKNHPFRKETDYICSMWIFRCASSRKSFPSNDQLVHGSDGFIHLKSPGLGDQETTKQQKISSKWLRRPQRRWIFSNMYIENICIYAYVYVCICIYANIEIYIYAYITYTYCIYHVYIHKPPPRHHPSFIHLEIHPSSWCPPTDPPNAPNPEVKAPR